jgi:zinc protease
VAEVQKHVLSNGMTVLLKEVHSAPLISWWVLYRVGSRNESTGVTGVSHWVEHMLFKGTDKYPPGYLDKAVDRVGGAWNAQTFFDYTAYYETLPAEHIQLGLEIEADRMMNARFDPEEVASERTVIVSERQGMENSPGFWLGEEMQAAAFRVHGYHHEIIGDMSDLHTMTREDLYGHYRQHYMPNNAIAVAVGAFDSAKMLEKIRAVYEPIPAGEAPAVFVRPEPVQNGERRVTVERPGGSAMIEIAYKAPPASHDDWFALALINSLLCGPDSLGGSSIDNRTSRLYRALVETEIAAGVDGSLVPTIDPYLYSISATVRPGRTPQEVEAAVNAEIARLLAGEISEAELVRAKKQARALFAYSTERVTMQAFWLAFCENFSSYTWFEEYVSRLEAVTLDDVLRTARDLLRPQFRTVGVFLPTAEADDADDGEEMDE